MATEDKASFKYGVEDLAKELDIQPASARVALRKAGVEKNGTAYGWNSEKDFKAVIAKLKTASAPAKADKPAKAKEKSKADKPAKAKKAA